MNGFSRHLFCALCYWRALHIYLYQVSSMDNVPNNLPFMPTSEMIVANYAAWVLRGSKISCDWCLNSVLIWGIFCLFRANEQHFDFANENWRNFTLWPCIVTNFFIIKPTKCTNFTHLFWHETTCFGQFLCPSSGVYSLYTRQWYMSFRFVDGFRAGPGWNCSSVLVLLQRDLKDHWSKRGNFM